MPFETARAFDAPQNSANIRSNWPTNRPSDDSMPESRHSRTFARADWASQGVNTGIGWGGKGGGLPRRLLRDHNGAVATADDFREREHTSYGHLHGWRERQPSQIRFVGEGVHDVEPASVQEASQSGIQEV